MKTPWHHPDLEPLIRAARNAIAEETEDKGQKSAALNALYREIGHRIVSLATEAEADKTSAQEGLRVAHPLPKVALAVPPPPPPKQHQADTNTAKNVVNSHAPQWCHSVVALLHLTESPRVIHAYTDLSVEAARLLWATLSIQSLNDEVPDAMLTALFGLLSARCHHLCTQLDNPWIPNTVLREVSGRAQQMNIEGLGALATPPKSIFGDWFEEALHWWDVVHHGLQPHLEEQK